MSKKNELDEARARFIRAVAPPEDFVFRPMPAVRVVVVEGDEQVGTYEAKVSLSRPVFTAPPVPTVTLGVVDSLVAYHSRDDHHEHLRLAAPLQDEAVRQAAARAGLPASAVADHVAEHARAALGIPGPKGPRYAMPMDDFGRQMRDGALGISTSLPSFSCARCLAQGSNPCVCPRES